MKISPILMKVLWLSLIAVGTFGCASPYKHVLVSVVDSNTRQPIRGTTVRAWYPMASWSSWVSHQPDKAVTGETGEAMLRVNPTGGGPFYDVVIANDQYDEHFGYSSSSDELAERANDFIPLKPDIELEVTSKKDLARLEVEAEKKQKSDEEAAEKLFRDSPEFWPEHKEEPYPFLKDEIGEILVRKRWKGATKTLLGVTEDLESIRKAVIAHMKHPQSIVGEIGWISPTLVMVSCSWHTSPLASAGYTYVLRKDGTTWVILTRYMSFVS